MLCFVLLPQGSTGCSCRYKGIIMALRLGGGGEKGDYRAVGLSRGNAAKVSCRSYQCGNSEARVALQRTYTSWCSATGH